MTIHLPKRVAENIDHFTGRDWLLPEVLSWWEDRPDERLFLLTGGPGTGKSMILGWLSGFGPQPEQPTAQAQLKWLRNRVKAVYFVQASARNYTPQAFSESIANQLTGTINGFGDALAATLAERVQIVADVRVGSAESGSTVTGNKFGSINLAGLGDEFSFDQAFTRPLKQLYAAGHTDPMLLLVDALDEAQTYTGVTLPDLLSRLDLPAPVRILATTRKDPRVLKFFRRIEPFDLIEDATPDVDDVRTYAKGRLAKLYGVTDEKRSDFAVRLAQQANGVFSYAAMVLEELLERPPAECPELDTYPLPDGLSGLYHDFLIRELGKDEQRWDELYEPLLGLIAVAQGDGLTRQHLTDIMGKDIRVALRSSKQYLSGDLPDGPFRPFHRSFADFLLEEKDNRDFHIDAPTMHKRIAEYYWSKYHEDWAWERSDEYALRNLPVHLFEQNARVNKEENESRNQLIALLSNFKWINTKLHKIGLSSLLADYDLCADDAELAHIRRVIVRSSHILGRDKSQLGCQMISRLAGSRGEKLSRLTKQIIDLQKDIWWLRRLNQARFTHMRRKIDLADSAIAEAFFIPSSEAVVFRQEDGALGIARVGSKKIDRHLYSYFPEGKLLGALSENDICISKDRRNVSILRLDDKTIRSLGDHKAHVTAVDSSRGHLMASGDIDGLVKIWDLASGVELATSPLVHTAITSVALSENRTEVIIGTQNGSVIVWNWVEKKVFDALQRHPAPVTAIIMTSDASRCISGGGDGSIIFWKLNPFKLEKAAFGVDRRVSAIFVTPDLNYLFIGCGEDKLVKKQTDFGLDYIETTISANTPCSISVIDLRTNTKVSDLEGHMADVIAIKPGDDANGNGLLSVSKDGTLIEWAWDAVGFESIVHGHNERIGAIAMASNNKLFVTASNDGTVRAWRLEDDPEQICHYSHSDRVFAVAINLDSNLILSCSYNGELKLFDVAKCKEVYTAESRYVGALGLAISPDSSVAMLGSYDGRLRVLNVADKGNSVLTFKGFGSVMDAEFLKRGRSRALVVSERELVVFKVEPDHLKLEALSTGPHDRGRRVAFSADEQRMVLALGDKNAVIWRISEVNGKLVMSEIATLSGHVDNVWDVAIDAAGQIVVTVSEDSTVRIWNGLNGEELCHFFGDHPIDSCAITADGEHLVVGDSLGSIYHFELVRPLVNPDMTKRL